MTHFDTGRRLAAEAIGTALLLATVVGSGIMGERLAGGNEALALLGNTIATGAILVVIILMFAGVSGAHFNPAVTLTFLLRREIGLGLAVAYIVVQVAGALFGMGLAHTMFEEPIFQLGVKARTGPAQWLAEVVATFGFVATILATVRFFSPAGRRLCGRSFYYGRLLVHRLDIFRQSGGDRGTCIYRHFQRHRAG